LLQCGTVKNLVDIERDCRRLVNPEARVIQDRHPVEWVQRQVGRAAQFGFEIMKIERDLLMRQDEPDDVDKGADRKSQKRRQSFPE